MRNPLRIHPGSWVPCLWLAMLGLASLPGCATETTAPGRAQLSSGAESSEDLFPQGAILVSPGQLDAEDRYLSSVMVLVGSGDPSGFQGRCSGVLIHPRLVITAGHCVCTRRSPTPDDRTARGNESTASGPSREGRPIQRAAVLRSVELTGIIDTKSPCVAEAEVFTASYAPTPARAPQQRKPLPSHGKVLVHPGLELVFGKRSGAEQVMWSNADLAAILLDQPIPLQLQRLELAEAEVQVGDLITLVGFGPGTLTPVYGFRHFGDNKVNRLIPLETGSAVFRAEEQELSDGSTASHAQPGDSGGACIKKGDKNVLVGITTVGAEKPAGGHMSVFTSIYSHRSWLRQMLQKADES